jgi:hypothetical protein
MRQVEIVYGNSLTINRSNYENEKPLYSAKSVVTIADGEVFDERAEYQRLRGIVDPLVDEHYNRAKLDISKVRVRVKDGKKYPSVTSIMNPLPLNIDPDYAVRGSEIHRLVNRWIEQGKWDQPREPLNKLNYTDIKYKEFFADHEKSIDFIDCKVELEIFNDERLYSGEVDLICKVDGETTLADIKTGQWKWCQLCAYAKALPDLKIKQLAIFDLKKNKLEVLKLTDPKARFEWENFLIQRGAFEKMYGI